MQIRETILSIFIYLFFSFQISNAQDIVSSQYYSNLATYNPAFTGIDDFVDLKLSVYQGWNSFNTRNNNFYISAFGSINNPQQASIKNNALRISSSAYQQIEAERDLRRKHGMGGIISARNIGPYRSASINYQYAYHLPISSGYNFSMGARVSYLSQRIDFSGFEVRRPDEDIFYQQLMQSSNSSQSSYLVDFGLLLYSDVFYFGVSSSNIVKGRLSSDALINFNDAQQIQMNTAGNFRIASNVLLNTGLQLNWQQGYPLGWAANVRARYKELLYVGSGYNHNSKLSLLLGISISSKLNLHYSYDQYLSSLSGFNVNAHEIVLGLSIFNTSYSQPKFW
jgi:type IX secretion system PorP/SprF family membrane protein